MTRPRGVTIVIAHPLSHLSDGSVVRGLSERCVRERAAVAELLAYLGEFDARRLYRAHGLSSSYAYCVKVLGFSEDSACRRIDIARKGREFPGILQRLADGSLHLTGAALLADHLDASNAEGLLAAAAHKTKAQIEHLLAERFPRADLPTRLVPLVPLPVAMAMQAQAAEPRADESSRTEPTPGACPDPDTSHAPAPPFVPDLDISPALARVNVPSLDEAPAPPPVIVRVPRPRVKPLAPERYGLQATIDQQTHDDLRRAQELLRHQVPDGNVSEVLKRALRLLVRTLERRKFGVTDRPRASRVAKSPAPGADPRHIPAHVRRAVWERDGGRCTFVSETGRRCDERAGLEYDHATPVARGGTSTIGNLRLRCRAHNQLEAERVYGAEFMRHKRDRARDAAAERARTRAGLRRAGAGGRRVPDEGSRGEGGFAHEAGERRGPAAPAP